jgi:hypothetical protein
MLKNDFKRLIYTNKNKNKHMANNLTKYNDFKKKVVNEKKETKINEANLVGDIMRSTIIVDVPRTLLKAFSTKLKNETGQDIHDNWSDSLLADELVKYVVTNFLTIEQLPVSIVTGQAQGGKAQVQVQQPAQQVQAPPQSQAQVPPQSQAPAQAPAQAPQSQGQASAQVPPQQTQQTPQQTAQTIPSREPNA